LRYTREVAEFVGLLFMLLAVLFIALPILSFLRLGRISAELEALHQRVRTLEQARTAAPPAASVAASRPEPLRTATAEAAPEPAAPAAPAAIKPPPPHIAPHPAIVAEPLAPPPPSTAAHPVLGSLPESQNTAAGAADAVTSAQARDAIGTSASDFARTAPVASSTHPEARPLESATADDADLEERIGGRGLLYVGVLVLLIGVSFFLKYAFDNEWINETGRVALGVLAGVGLIAVGLRFATRGLDVFGHALAGAGFAVLYLAIYAALNFYGLIPNWLAFALMLAVTIAAGVTADHRRSQPLAVIAVAGGFMTPFLVGGDEDAQLTLFTYVALLIGATMFLSLRHQWLALNAVSYVLTYMTVLSWASLYYDRDLWFRTLLFLTLFCILFLIVFRETRRSRTATARAVAGLLATGPVLYHVAAVMITAGHPPAIHLYLISFTVVGLWRSADPHLPWVRLGVLLGALVPMLGTLTLPNGLSWITANVVTIGAVGALHVFALVDRVGRQDESLELPDLISLHVAGLGVFSLLYSTLLPVYPQFRGALAATLAAGALGLWRWFETRDHVASLNAAALGFTLLALAVAVQFDGPTVVVGWAAEGAAAVWFGLRARSRHFQIGGLFLFMLAAGRLLDGYFATPTSFMPVLNSRGLTTWFIVVLGYVMAWLASRQALERADIARAALHVFCSVMTLLWITAEIRSYWALRYLTTQAYLYEQVMLSLAWAVYAAVLIVIGMRRKYKPLRYIGMVIIALTATKLFFYDLWELGGIYRIIAALGLGVLLVLVSYLYQKRRTPARPPAEVPVSSNGAATP
jgi:uncharacterized membrane protein